MEKKRKINITDVTLRDGQQSIIATRMKTEDIIPACEMLDKINLYSIEVWGGATYDSCIRFLNEDPWERLKKIRNAMPNTKLQMLVRGQNILGYKHYPDKLVKVFIKKAVDYGIDIFRVFDALNDIRNLESSINEIKKLKKHVQGAICYTISPVHTIDTYTSLAKTLYNLGVDSICIKDMAGLLTPYEAFHLVSSLKKVIDIPISIHSHSTTGFSVATLIKSIEAGADIIDTCFSPFSLQTSHSPIETMVYSLKDNFKIDINFSNLKEIQQYFEKLRKKYSSYATKTIINTKILYSQIPGGMLSNLENQLKKQNVYDKLDEVLEEVQIVRKDFGYPPLVTPTSQIIGTQAVINVLSKKRYSTLTLESKNLLVGKYGKLPYKVDQNLLNRALKELEMEKPIENRPADYLTCDLDKLKKETKSLTQTKKIKIEDVLTYAFFPNVAKTFFKNRELNNIPKEINEIESNGEEKTFLVKIDNETFTVKVKPSTTMEIEKLKINSSEDKNSKDQISNNFYLKNRDNNLISDKEDIYHNESMNNNLDSFENKQNAMSKKQLNNSLVLSPVSGVVHRIIKPQGAIIRSEEVVLIIEAMKVEFEIKAPKFGKLNLYVKEGDQIKSEDQLFSIE